MVYCVSDIHGELGKLEQLLELIRFPDADHMYIIGDRFLSQKPQTSLRVSSIGVPPPTDQPCSIVPQTQANVTTAAALPSRNSLTVCRLSETDAQSSAR